MANVKLNTYEHIFDNIQSTTLFTSVAPFNEVTQFAPLTIDVTLAVELVVTAIVLTLRSRSVLTATNASEKSDGLQFG
jgi:hypothetical protein